MLETTILYTSNTRLEVFTTVAPSMAYSSDTALHELRGRQWRIWNISQGNDTLTCTIKADEERSYQTGRYFLPGIRDMWWTDCCSVFDYLDKRTRIYQRWIILVLHRDKCPLLFPSLSFLNITMSYIFLLGEQMRLFPFPLHRQTDENRWKVVRRSGGEVKLSNETEGCWLFIVSLSTWLSSLTGIRARASAKTYIDVTATLQRIPKQRRTVHTLAWIALFFVVLLKYTATHTFRLPFRHCRDYRFHCSSWQIYRIRMTTTFTQSRKTIKFV